MADPETLAKYYGKGFVRRHLPKRTNLEHEPKAALRDKLAKATRGTVKGVYLKIHHAGQLLARINPDKVACRCACFGAFRGMQARGIAQG